eukprot:g5020.t1
MSAEVKGLAKALKIGRLQYKKIVGIDPDAEDYTAWVMENVVLSNQGLKLRKMEVAIRPEEMDADLVAFDENDPNAREKTHFNIPIIRDEDTGRLVNHQGLTTDGIFRFRAKQHDEAADWILQIHRMLNADLAAKADEEARQRSERAQLRYAREAAKVRLGSDEPWLIAVQNGDIKEVKTLISRAKKVRGNRKLKADSAMRNMDKEEMERAIKEAEEKNKDAIKKQIGVSFEKSCNFSLVCVDVRKRAAIHLAACQGHIKILKLLVREMLRAKPKHDLDIKDSGGWTALHLASTVGNLECVQALLKAKCNVRTVNNHGFTPLHCAAGRGHTEVVRTLIDAGANVFAVTDDAGNSPLHLAAKEGYMDVLKLLVEAGCEFRAENRKGVTAFDLACYRQHKDVLTYFQTIAPADPNYPITKKVKKMFEKGTIRELGTKEEEAWKAWEEWNSKEAEAPIEEEQNEEEKQKEIENSYNRPIPQQYEY